MGSGQAGAATTLTETQLSEMRAAARRSGTFIDPHALTAVTSAHFHKEWAEAVLGGPFRGIRRSAGWELSLLAAALEAEPVRPVPAAVQARAETHERTREDERRREAEATAARLDAWHVLRNSLPVPVTVGHNWTIGHWESGHVTGQDHIVVQADLRIGRLRRTVKDTLCETPAKTRQGTRNKDPLRGVDRDDDGEDCVPTCKACLKLAERLAHLHKRTKS